MADTQQISLILNALNSFRGCAKCGARIRFGDLECPKCGDDIYDDLCDWASNLIRQLEEI